MSYPSVPQELVSSVSLVTSGHVSDPAKDKIRLASDELVSRGYSGIRTIELPQLRAEFCSYFESFLPNTVHDFTKLLQLYVQDAAAPINAKSLLEFFDSVSHAQLLDARSRGAGELSDRELYRLLSSLLVLGEFLASPYRRSENAVAIIQVWTAVALTCLGLEAQAGGQRGKTVTALDICKEAIREACESLISQCVDFESAIRDRSLSGILLAGFKKTYVLGYLAAVANMHSIDGDSDLEAFDSLAKAVDGATETTFWGEGSWNYVLNMSCALYRHDGTRFLGRSIIENWVEYLLRGGDSSPPDCYHTIEEEFERITGRKAESRVHRSSESSYTLRSATDFLARDGARLVISANWKKITDRTQLEFIANNRWDQLKYRSDHGVQRSTRFPVTGHWAELQTTAMRTRECLFPEHSWLMPFFLLLLPHRISPGLSGELHWLTADESDRRRWSSGKAIGRKTVL